MSGHHDNVRAGLCSKCAVPRAVGDGGTRTLCKACADAKREAGMMRYRRRVGIPLDAPRAPQGRPRTEYQPPTPIPGPQPPA